MEEPSRYSVSDGQAGIEDGVLKNKLHYTSQQDLDNAETVLQSDAYQHFFDVVDTQEVVFNVQLIFTIHKYFFEPLYDWAGIVRTVDISKGEMLFAPVQHLESTIKQLDHDIQNHIPVNSDTAEDIATKFAFIHNEYNVVHPFRDGNGRTIRLFLDMLARSLGYDPINYGDTEKYFAACVAGAIGDHESMANCIQRGLIRKSGLKHRSFN